MKVENISNVAAPRAAKLLTADKNSISKATKK